MAVMMERGKWTDERLDEFAKRIDERFDCVDERFDEIDRRFAQVDARFAQVDARFEALHSLMWHGFIALVGFQLTMAAAIIGFIAVRT